MGTAIENKYHWNEDRRKWERVDRVQEYRGHKIESVTWHYDNDWITHREYRVTRPSGIVNYWGNMKRGGSIKNIKDDIDFNYKYDRKEHL
jgi:hypothetical protein